MELVFYNFRKMIFFTEIFNEAVTILPSPMCFRDATNLFPYRYFQLQNGAPWAPAK